MRVALENTPGLRAGMMGRLSLQTDSAKGVLKIPRSCVVSREDKDYVFVVRSGRAQRVSVELGLADEREVEVRSGLKRGESVVSRGADGLSSGTKVVVMKEGRGN